MKEQKPPNNLVSLEEYRKRKEALVVEIEGAIKAGLQSIGSSPESEFKFLSEIYSSILQTFARKFAGLGNYDLGSKNYDSKESSMLLTFGFAGKKFTDFLDFLEKRSYLTPKVLKEKMAVYIGEHDHFLDSPAARISAQGFERINDSRNVPVHEEDSLNYREGEFEKLKDIGLQLRAKLRELAEVE